MSVSNLTGSTSGDNSGETKLLMLRSLLSSGCTAGALPAAHCGEGEQCLRPVAHLRHQQQLPRPPDLLPSQDVELESRDKGAY